MDATSGGGTSYISWTHEFTPGCKWDSFLNRWVYPRVVSGVHYWTHEFTPVVSGVHSWAHELTPGCIWGSFLYTWVYTRDVSGVHSWTHVLPPIASGCCFTFSFLCSLCISLFFILFVVTIVLSINEFWIHIGIFKLFLGINVGTIYF